jgi:predicted transcriptional regulator
MVKLKWNKEWKIRKPGDISNVSKKSAENFVSQGFAEYVEEDKPKTQVQKWREEKNNLSEWECVTCGTHVFFNNRKDLKCSCGNKNTDKFIVIKRVQQKTEFKFDSENPEENIDSLDKLEKIIKNNFPSIWFETKTCLSAYSTLALKNLNGCPSLNLIGSPSGEKTTVLSFFYNASNSYISDDFTPRSFVSHSTTVKKEDLEELDLLPKIKNMVLITPELAPLFEAPKDKLLDNFSILTRVLDGEGLNRDSGAHGHRGYSGDYKFVWLGASTPLKPSVWNVMGKIGNRLFFLNMKDKNRSNQDYLDMFKGKAYEEKVRVCRGAVRNFLENFFRSNKIRSIDWDAEGDIFLLPEIIKYAKLLSKLRGSLMLWKSEDRGKYEFNFPIIEEPPRAINALYNLAKGHAMINKRNFLRKEDLEIVRAVCFSSMPHDRVEFLKLLGKHEGKLTTRQIENELNCSQDTALRTMNVFKILGIVDIKNIQIDYTGNGRPMNYIEIKDEFKELLEETHVLNNEIKSKPDENNGVFGDYDSINLEDFVKNPKKSPGTHHRNDEINTKSQQINPVCDDTSNSSNKKYGVSGEKIDFSELDKEFEK